MVAGSNVVTGAGTSSRTFTLPASPLYRVESVVAHVDNTAGGDTTATLTYADTNGEVIAKKPQGSTVPAGGTGTATFALRLSDDASRAASAYPVGFYTVAPPGGNPVPAGTQGAVIELTFAGAGAGVDLLDTSTLGSPAQWCVKTSGVYTVMARIGVDPHPFGVFPAGHLMLFDLTPIAADPPPANFWATQNTTKLPLDNALGSSNQTVSVTRYMPVLTAPGSPYLWHLQVSWDYVGDVDVTGFLEVIKIG